jgi:hypothetical protein
MSEAECTAVDRAWAAAVAGLSKEDMRAAFATRAATCGAEVEAAKERRRAMTGAELLEPVLAEIDRLAALRFDNATEREAATMVAGCSMAGAVLCALSGGGVGLDGLGLAVGRLYRSANTDHSRRMAVCTMAMLRHTLLPLPGDGWWPFLPSLEWFSADEVAEYCERYPRR